MVQKTGWAPELVWTDAENVASPLGFDLRNVQPVASRYTDYAIPAHEVTVLDIPEKLSIDVSTTSILN